MTSRSILFLSYRDLRHDPRHRRLSQHFIEQGYIVHRVFPNSPILKGDIRLQKRNLALRILALRVLRIRSALGFLFRDLADIAKLQRTGVDFSAIVLCDLEWVVDINRIHSLYPSAKLHIDFYENYIDPAGGSRTDQLFQALFQKAKELVLSRPDLTFSAPEATTLEAYNQIFSRRGVLVRNSRPLSDFIEVTDDRNQALPLRFVHHGFLGSNRGLEQYLSLVSKVPHASLTIFTPSSPIQRLKVRLNHVNASFTRRLSVRPAVAYEALPRVLSQFDAGLCVITGRNLNASLALPNKVFDFIAAGLPFVAGPGSSLVGLARSLGQFSVTEVSEQQIRQLAQSLSPKSLRLARKSLISTRRIHALDRDLANLEEKLFGRGVNDTLADLQND